MVLTRVDLERLLALVATGDRNAFTQVYTVTSLKLFGIVFRILRRQELAEEVLQEVYLRIWQRAGEFEPGRASPITWMATIARNRAIDLVRKRELPLVDDDQAVFAVKDGSRSAADLVEVADDLARLEECLSGLDAERSDAIRLAYLDGASRAALAERFDQPVGTIKTWLHRGLKQLKECLGS